MDFEELVRKSDYSNQKELVGTAIYYLEEYGDSDTVTTSEVRNLFKTSRVSMSENGVAARIKDLRESDLLTKAGEENQVYQYRLSIDGFDYFKNMCEPQEDDQVREGRFLKIDDIEEEYYEKLVGDINKSYQYGINDGTLVLTRKLFENFIIDILRAEYGGQGIDLYYNTEKGRFHGLGTLCGKLDDKSSDLDHYSRHLDNGLVARVEQFKEHGNSQAHSVRVNISDDELEDMSTEATELTKILYDIRDEVRIANG